MSRTKQPVIPTLEVAIKNTLNYAKAEKTFAGSMRLFFLNCNADDLKAFNAAIIGKVDQVVISKLNNNLRNARSTAKTNKARLPSETNLIDGENYSFSLKGLVVDKRAKPSQPTKPEPDASSIVGKSETVKIHVDYKTILAALPSMTNAELQKLSQTIEAIKNERLAAKSAKQPRAKKTGTK